MGIQRLEIEFSLDLLAPCITLSFNSLQPTFQT